MSSIPIVALYGALNAFLNVGLASYVSLSRTREGVSLGVGNSRPLELAVRSHGNNAEFVPLALLMLLIAELQGGASLWLHVLGGMLLVGRVLHPIGLRYRAPNFARLVGTTLTWITIVATGVYCLALRGA